MASRSEIEAALQNTGNDMKKVTNAANDTKAAALDSAAYNMRDPNFIGELAALDLNKIIGGPLCAAIKGMTQASAVTLDFIKNVCFTPGDPLGEPVMVQFELSRPGGIFGMMAQTTKIQVPFMTMVNIPHLRLAKVRVEFNVHLTSTRTSQLGTTTSATIISTQNYSKTTTKESGRWETANTTTNTLKRDDSDSPWYWDTSKTKSETPMDVDKDEWTQSASMIGITSSQETATSGATVSKDYSLQIVVTAVQDELPRGLEKILDILESQINEAADDPLGNMLMQKMTSSIGQPASFGPPGGAGAGAGAGMGAPPASAPPQAF